MNDIQCLIKLYPQVVTTRNDVAYDIDGNEVTYDKFAVEAYAKSQEYIYKRATEYPSIVD